MHFNQELLYDNHLCINGSKLEQSGFSYKYPELTVEALREVSVFCSFLPSKLSRSFFSCRSSLVNWTTSIITEQHLNCFINLIFLSRCLMIMYRQDCFLLHWPSEDDVFNSIDASIPVKFGVERNEENLNRLGAMIAPLTF